MPPSSAPVSSPPLTSLPGPALSEVDATYKSREVEGLLDLYFYRVIGFRLARWFAQRGVTPKAVTLIGGVIGLLAGHLYFYRTLLVNVAGMVMHVFSNAMDNADGQLARMTKSGSRAGRVLDGLTDNIVFANIYLQLCLRYVFAGGSLLVFVLALAAGISHSLQSAAADYFRNSYLYFVSGRHRSELESATTLRAQFDSLSWRTEPFKKLLLRFYLNYTIEQEALSPPLVALRDASQQRFGAELPSWLSARYRRESRPMLKWLNVLTTNTRMILLFVLLIIHHPVWYFVVELTAFNGLLVYVLWRQNENYRELLQFIQRPVTSEL